MWRLAAGLMKLHVSTTVLAAVVGLHTETVQANVGQAGGGRANWYLRAPDGSRQGPYALPQLGEWSSAGYVSPGGGVCRVWCELYVQ